MATRILGPTGSKRRRRFLFVPILLVACTALLLVGSARAVHDEAVFQLDGNASTALPSSPTATEDWDLICKANRVQVGTLNAGINSSTTSITVNETSSLPGATLPVNIQIGSEQMTVSFRTGSSNPRTYTVTRAIDGTTAAAHSATDPVFSGCLFQHAYTPPAGTTVASPSKFIVDQSSNTVDDILKAGTKDDNDIPSWSWTTAGALDKDDLTNGYAAEYTCNGTEPNSASCNGTTGDKLIYFGTDRYAINGSSNVAFWFFQHDVREKSNPNAPPGQCTLSAGCSFTDQNGNAVTHKVGNVSLGGSLKTGCSPAALALHPTNVCTPGDILVIGAFGPHASLNVYEWVGALNATKDYNGSNSCFTAACSLQPVYTAANGDCGAVGNNDNACAVANTSVSASPWILPQKNIQGKAVGDRFNADASKGYSSFFEGGLNLTGLGLGGACFSSFLINSRASASGDSELHDKLLGSFQRCAPNLTTQVKNGSGTSTNGTIQPGTAVHDTATVSVTGASSPDDATGTMDFYICGPDASAAPNCDGTTGHVGTLVSSAVALADTSNPANTHDGVSGASSADVNGSGSELGNGYYCFRASPHLTNYDNPVDFTNSTTECFRVLKLSTSIVTAPQSPAGTDNTGPFSLASNTQVVDHAVVTGDAADGFPEGTVTFFICDPSQVTGLSGAEVCAAGDGNQVGTAVTATDVQNETIKTEATSDAVAANQLGVWCFRAVYDSTSAVYNGTSGGGHEECFTVNTTSSGTSAQNWLPNDHVTVSTATGSLAGTLSITLRSGTCNGTVRYTEPVPSSGAFTATAAGATYNTTNGSDAATAFRVNTANAGTYYWRIVFTPTSSFATGFTKCETSTVSPVDDVDSADNP